MLFSPSTMQTLPIRTLPISRYYEKGGKAETTVFHYRGSLTTLMGFLRFEMSKEGKTPLIQFVDSQESSRHWGGFQSGETIRECIEKNECRTAHQAYEKANSAFQVPYKPGTMRMAPMGVYIIPRVLMGHPYCAIQRPKVALPPKEFHFGLSVSASVDHATVTGTMARVVNAAVNYKLRGGPVSLTVHYLLGFSKSNPETKANGILFSLEIPLGSDTSASFSGSIQFFRGILIPIAQVLSGLCPDYDALHVLTYNRPGGLIALQGRATDGDQVIEAMKIR